MSFDKHILCNHRHNQNIKYSHHRKQFSPTTQWSAPHTHTQSLTITSLSSVANGFALFWGHSWPTLSLSCLSPVPYGSSSLLILYIPMVTSSAWAHGATLQEEGEAY